MIENYSEIIFNHMLQDPVRFAHKNPDMYRDFYKFGQVNPNRSFSGDELNQIFIDYILQEDQKNRKNKRRLFHASYPFYNAKNRELYYLVFFSKNKEGFDTIKTSLWSVSDGLLEHKNLGHDPNQISLFDVGNKDLEREMLDSQIRVKVEELKEDLSKQFKGETVSVKEILEYVKIETKFHSGQVKNKTLRPMEDNGKILCKRKSEHSSRSFRDDVLVTFA